MSHDNHGVEHTDGIVEAGQKEPMYFNILFYGLILWGVIFIAYFLLSGWSSEAEFTEKMAAHKEATGTAPAATTAAPAPVASSGAIDASAIYASTCAGCHRADGEGGFGSDLTAATYKFGKDSESVKTSISEGRGGKMPGFGSQLSAAELDALTDYILQL